LVDGLGAGEFRGSDPLNAAGIEVADHEGVLTPILGRGTLRLYDCIEFGSILHPSTLFNIEWSFGMVDGLAINVHIYGSNNRLSLLADSMSCGKRP